ncbi:MAG: cytochrome P450, partial [Pseudomonadota bacterium]|nr:cytochrome P450 [Pseudomonadota bacterium]
MSKVSEFSAQTNRLAQSRLLFSWLADDRERADLYQCLANEKQVLRFQSRADTKRTDNDPSVFQQDVYLLADPEHVQLALTDPRQFGNDPYQALGSGTFMLGLGGAAHDRQRAFATAVLAANSELDLGHVAVLSVLAYKTASIQPLKERYFDVAELAEQAALRFAGFFFGYALGDHYLLETTLRKAYRGLNHQILGRHFVSDPFALLEANAAMGQLLVRTALLIDLYRQPVGVDQQEEAETIEREFREVSTNLEAGLDRLKVPTPRPPFKPILKRLAEAPGDYSCSERAVIAVGLMAGMVGNVQAAVSIAVADFFATGWPRGWEEPKALQGRISEALRKQPPAAFLPRVTRQQVHLRDARGQAHQIPAGATVLLAMGAAPAANVGFDHVFGGSLSNSQFVHSCIGRHLAMPLVATTVREVLSLPGLAQTIDPKTGATTGLKKLWGFKCESYPLQFNRDAVLIQQPLNVIMRVKTPVSFHAEALKLVIKYGAPRIELKLKGSRHVHFAWFQFLENDTKLALLTVYDGDFDAY